MVRQGFWVAGLLCFAISWSGETGSLSARAHQMYQNGRYPQAVHLLQRALAASAKDADLEAESRIYMDLAQIFIEEMEYDAAADALGQIPTNKISTASRLFSLRLRLQLLNQQEKYAEAWNVYNAEAQTISQAGASVLRGLLYLEAAEAAAGIAANVSVQSKLLKRAERDLDDETPGPLAMAKARVADLSGHPDTALYQNALHLAQQSHRSWEIGQILFFLGQVQLKQGHQSAAMDAFSRAAKVYWELALQKHFLQAAQARQGFRPTDPQLETYLEQIRSVSSSSTDP